jgi:hypothetical protein
MHLRVLPPRQRDRQSFVHAAMGRAQLRIDEMAQRVDLGANLRVTIERVDARQRQQHEGVVVGIAQRIQHGAIRGQGVDKARPAVRGFRFRQKMIQALQRNRAAVGIPAHLRRLGVAIDLARLHKHPARRQAVRAAVRIEPIDKAARYVVPAFGRPQRQALLDHAKLQPRDDIGRIQRICRRGGISFSHCVPWNINTGRSRLIARQRRRAIGPHLRHQP